MSGSNYQPLSQGEDLPLTPSGSRLTPEPFPERPPTYYGEGVFSPPSSPSVDEDAQREADEKRLERRRSLLRQGMRPTEMDVEDMHPDYLPPYDSEAELTIGKVRTNIEQAFLRDVCLTGFVLYRPGDRCDTCCSHSLALSSWQAVLELSRPTRTTAVHSDLLVAESSLWIMSSMGRSMSKGRAWTGCPKVWRSFA